VTDSIEKESVGIEMKKIKDAFSSHPIHC